MNEIPERKYSCYDLRAGMVFVERFSDNHHTLTHIKSLVHPDYDNTMSLQEFSITPDGQRYDDDQTCVSEYFDEPHHIIFVDQVVWQLAIMRGAWDGSW